MTPVQGRHFNMYWTKKIPLKAIQQWGELHKAFHTKKARLFSDKLWEVWNSYVLKKYILKKERKTLNNFVKEKRLNRSSVERDDYIERRSWTGPFRNEDLLEVFQIVRRLWPSLRIPFIYIIYRKALTSLKQRGD